MQNCVYLTLKKKCEHCANEITLLSELIFEPPKYNCFVDYLLGWLIKIKNKNTVVK